MKKEINGKKNKTGKKESGLNNTPWLTFFHSLLIEIDIPPSMMIFSPVI